MTKKILIIAVAIITIISAQTAFADIKVKSKQTMAGQSYENTTYIKGKRQRTDSMGGVSVSITQCDLRRAIQMNPAAKTFMVDEFGKIEPSSAKSIPANTNLPVTRGGRIVMTVNIKDTGERKQMFGFQARRLIITMSTQSSPEACSKTNTRMETDGWYIDFDSSFDCDRTYEQQYIAPNSGGCRDKFEVKQTGAGKRGYPVYEKMTMFDESGKETMSMVTEVVELSKATLDAALFEVPSDYREVSDASQLYAVSPSSMMETSVGSNGIVNGGSNASTMSMPNVEAPTSAAVGPKQNGVIRIGIANVKTGSVGEGITANDLSAAVQNTLIAYLKLPNVQVVPIEARLAAGIDAEARQKECDLVIHATVSHKKGGGGFGGLGKAFGQAVAVTGIGNTGSTAGNIAGQIATRTIVSATSVSANVKAKDEITLDIKLERISGASEPVKQYKAKAKSNGDDIITKVVEPAAEAIAAAIK